MRSPIRYPGGKGNYVKQYLQLMPQHNGYGEPFGGGASLLFAKPPTQLDVYNDVNHALVNMYRVLRDPNKFEQLLHKLQLTPYSREEYQLQKATWFDEQDELESAYKFYVFARQGFAGNQMTDGWSYITNPNNSSCVSRWLGAIEMLPEIHKRLQYVQIEHLHYKDFFSRYDRSDMLFYVDPPYYNVPGVYKFDFTEQDHEHLVETISQLQAKVILSNYRNDLYDLLLNYDWQVVEFEVTSVTGASKQSKVKSAKRTEAVYTNYEVNIGQIR